MSATDDAVLPPEAWLAALAGLPGVGPNRLHRLLEHGAPHTVWSQVVAGHRPLLRRLEAPKVAAILPDFARSVDVYELWTRYRASGIGLLGRESEAYPAALRNDPEPPAVLFTKGDPSSVSDLRVGIVGTRQCTRYGVDLARDLGALCAEAGVSVVSGLAAGIDAAAHRGALAVGGGSPVGVVGTALDSPYPRQNRDLWEEVAGAGLVCGETPLDAPADRWRFPARNRIIAGLSHVVVVIESHERGGSLYTASQAMDRGKAVFAVPGPIHSPASVGCNRLLADGCLAVCDLSDVLVALGLSASTDPPSPVVVLEPSHVRVVEAIGWQASTVDELAHRTAMPVDELALAMEQLVGLEVVARRGPWIERTSRAIQARERAELHPSSTTGTSGDPRQVPSDPGSGGARSDGGAQRERAADEVDPGNIASGWAQGA